MCMPKQQPSPAERCRNFEAVSLRVGLTEEEFAAGGCSKLLTAVESKIECAALCSSEAKDSCVAFYFGKAKKECLLVLYTDATIDMGDARGWKKFIVKK